MRRLLATAALLLVTGCNLPVTPWVRFSAYSNPYYAQTEYEKRFTQWKSGNKGMAWSFTYRATAYSEAPLIIQSDAASSFGGLLPSATGAPGQFQPTRTELIKLVNDVLDTKVFDLYDGFYGAYDQGGGTIGPDLRIDVGGLQKHVAFDEDTSGWEAEAIARACDAVRNLGVKYLSAAKK